MKFMWTYRRVLWFPGVVTLTGLLFGGAAGCGEGSPPKAPELPSGFRASMKSHSEQATKSNVAKQRSSPGNRRAR